MEHVRFYRYFRREGAVEGINDKGLVTRDRKTKKDAFYFYQANWSDEPVLYITSRRFTERTNAVTDVKIYSNAKPGGIVAQREIRGQTQRQHKLRVCLERCTIKTGRKPHRSQRGTQWAEVERWLCLESEIAETTTQKTGTRPASIPVGQGLFDRASQRCRIVGLEQTIDPFTSSMPN